MKLKEYLLERMTLEEVEGLNLKQINSLANLFKFYENPPSWAEVPNIEGMTLQDLKDLKQDLWGANKGSKGYKKFAKSRLMNYWGYPVDNKYEYNSSEEIGQERQIEINSR